jgi:hypothetical protein
MRGEEGDSKKSTDRILIGSIALGRSALTKSDPPLHKTFFSVGLRHFILSTSSHTLPSIIERGRERWGKSIKHHLNAWCLHFSSELKRFKFQGESKG